MDFVDLRRAAAAVDACLAFLCAAWCLRPAWLGRRFCLLGMVSLLVTGSRCRITRKRGEHGQGAQTSQRPETLVHFVIPPRTRWPEPRDRPMHAVRTSQKLPHRRFSTVTFGQQRGENVAHVEQNVVARPVRVVMPPFLKSANEAGPHHVHVFRVATPRHDFACRAPERSEHRCKRAGANA